MALYMLDELVQEGRSMPSMNRTATCCGLLPYRMETVAHLQYPAMEFLFLTLAKFINSTLFPELPFGTILALALAAEAAHPLTQMVSYTCETGLIQQGEYSMDPLEHKLAILI